ncbi:MAG: 7-carboxy-7-deazaguanine synthase [Terracidiphilus sp.]
MTYAAKEIFYTLQGEGAQTGRAAVFCRFAGCNLWSGREADRAAAVCRFCDTDFAGVDGAGGGRFDSAQALAAAIAEKWPADLRQQGAGQQEAGRQGPASARRFVVCTGGEPLLQLDAELVAALHARDFEVAVETNGTLAAPPGLDWICVSPKAGAPLLQRSGDELKLVYPQTGLDPADLESLAFRHFFLQPMDGSQRTAHTAAALRYCLAHPRWRLSLQTHKFLGIA